MVHSVCGTIGIPDFQYGMCSGRYLFSTRITVFLPAWLFLQGVSVQFVRAYFECLRANTQKALKLLQSVSLTSVQSPGQNSLSMLYNNMACVYHEMRRPFTAVHNQRLAWLENERFTRQMRGSNKGAQSHVWATSLSATLLSCDVFYVVVKASVLDVYPQQHHVGDTLTHGRFD